MKRSRLTFLSLIAALLVSLLAYLNWWLPGHWLTSATAFFAERNQVLLVEKTAWDPFAGEWRLSGIQVRGKEGQLAYAKELLIKVDIPGWFLDHTDTWRFTFHGLEAELRQDPATGWYIGNRPTYTYSLDLPIVSLTLLDSVITMRHDAVRHDAVRHDAVRHEDTASGSVNTLRLAEGLIHTLRWQHGEGVIGGHLEGSWNQGTLAAEFRIEQDSQRLRSWMEIETLEGNSAQLKYLFPVQGFVESPLLRAAGQWLYVREGEAEQYTLSQFRIVSENMQLNASNQRLLVETGEVLWSELQWRKASNGTAHIRGRGSVNFNGLDWLPMEEGSPSHLAWHAERLILPDVEWQIRDDQLVAQTDRANLVGIEIREESADPLLVIDSASAQTLSLEAGNRLEVHQLRIQNPSLHYKETLSWQALGLAAIGNPLEVSLHRIELDGKGYVKWPFGTVNDDPAPKPLVTWPLDGIVMEGLTIGSGDQPFQLQQNLTMQGGSVWQSDMRVWPQRDFPTLDWRAALSNPSATDLGSLIDTGMLNSLPTENSRLEWQVQLTPEQIQGDVTYEQSSGHSSILTPLLAQPNDKGFRWRDWLKKQGDLIWLPEKPST